MSKGTKADNRTFADKMVAALKQEQESECERCPHKSSCTWYIVEHKEQIAAILDEVKKPLPKNVKLFL